jgi:hypothetical protein
MRVIKEFPEPLTVNGTDAPDRKFPKASSRVKVKVLAVDPSATPPDGVEEMLLAVGSAAAGVMLMGPEQADVRPELAALI